MNEHHTQEYRSEHAIIGDLELLVQENGFIYTFCHMVLGALWMSPDEIADIDWNQKAECSGAFLPFGPDG